MKIRNCIIILLAVTCVSIYGQSPTVQTPWGTTVNVFEQTEYTPSTRDYWDSYYENLHPDADFHVTWPVYPSYPNLSSSSRFNCHGYAWHMFWFDPGDELDDPYNMNSSEAEKYFTDPSFKECSKSEADIWWINNGSHSAVATDTENILISKWGIGPLATHHKDDHPYTSSTVTYYKKCFKEVTANYYSDITLEFCAVEFNNSSVSNNVDLEVEYEENLRIVGTFSTGTAATLSFHPD